MGHSNANNVAPTYQYTMQCGIFNFHLVSINAVWQVIQYMFLIKKACHSCKIHDVEITSLLIQICITLTLRLTAHITLSAYIISMWCYLGGWLVISAYHVHFMYCLYFFLQNDTGNLYVKSPVCFQYMLIMLLFLFGLIWV